MPSKQQNLHLTDTSTNLGEILLLHSKACPLVFKAKILSAEFIGTLETVLYKRVIYIYSILYREGLLREIPL